MSATVAACGVVGAGAAGRGRETRLALALALGLLVIVLDTTITVVAVPELVRVFDVDLATAQWTTTGYVLALVATMPTAAWVGRRVGTRRAYVAAQLLFAAASVWAGLAQGPTDLVAARVVQGLAAGLVHPLAFTLALRDTPAERRGRTSALLGLAVLVGPLVGPVTAGWLIEAASWRAIFFVTVPPALASAALVLRWAPRDEPARGDRVDLAGVLLLVPAAVALVFGLGQADAPATLRLGAVAVGLGLGAAFVRHALRHPAPLLDVRLLGDPLFRGGAVVLALFAAAYFGSMLLMPVYVQITRDDGALVAGSLMVPAAISTGLSLQVATRLVDRLPARRIVATGLGTALGAGVLGIAVLRADTPYPVLAAVGALLGAGAGAVLMPTMATATRALTGPALASGSAILGLLSQLANAAGNAATTALFAAMVAWRTPLTGFDEADRLSPGGRAAVVDDLVVAQQLTQAATVLLIGTALLVALRRLPRVRPGGNAPSVGGVLPASVDAGARAPGS